MESALFTHALSVGVVSEYMERWILLRLGGGKRRCTIDLQLSLAQLVLVYVDHKPAFGFFNCMLELNADSEGSGNFFTVFSHRLSQSVLEERTYRECISPHHHQ